MILETVVVIHENRSTTHIKFNLSQGHRLQKLSHDMKSRELLNSKGKILTLVSQKTKNKKEMKEGRGGGVGRRKKEREKKRKPLRLTHFHTFHLYPTPSSNVQMLRDVFKKEYGVTHLVTRGKSVSPFVERGCHDYIRPGGQCLCSLTLDLKQIPYLNFKDPKILVPI